METIKTLLEDAIIATGSKHYWSKSLIDRAYEEIRMNYNEEIAIEVLNDKIKSDDEFTYSELFKEIAQKSNITKELEYRHSESEYKVGWEAYLMILEVARTSKDRIEFFNKLEPLREVLFEKGLWQDEGRWARYIRGEEK